MFWSKAKQILKDKEAGLVFNWRNTFPLRYPLTAFVLLSLIAHFLFLQLFYFPERNNTGHHGTTGTVLLLSETSSPEIQRLLSYAGTLGIAAPRGTADIDPLTRGIDDQLSSPMTAGLYDWKPRAVPYPMTPFEETGTSDISWEYALPPVSRTFLNTPAAIADDKKQFSQPRITEASGILKTLLPKELPSKGSNEALSGKTVSFMVFVDRDGRLQLLSPLDRANGNSAALEEGARLLQSLAWNPSTEGGQGIVTLTWETADD